jgi:hypothetical protein
MILKKNDIFPFGFGWANRAAVNSGCFDPNKKFAIEPVIPGPHCLIINVFPFHETSVVLFKPVN